MCGLGWWHWNLVVDVFLSLFFWVYSCKELLPSSQLQPVWSPPIQRSIVSEPLAPATMPHNPYFILQTLTKALDLYLFYALLYWQMVSWLNKVGSDCMVQQWAVCIWGKTLYNTFSLYVNKYSNTNHKQICYFCKANKVNALFMIEHENELFIYIISCSLLRIRVPWPLMTFIVFLLAGRMWHKIMYF